MPTFRQLLTERIRAAFLKAGIAVPEGVAIEAVPAGDPRFGDYQSNAAMMVAKAMRADPRQTARLGHADVVPRGIAQLLGGEQIGIVPQCHLYRALRIRRQVRGRRGHGGRQRRYRRPSTVR